MAATHKQAKALDSAVSSDRLATYASAAGQRSLLARELYLWDRDLAAAIFADIAIVEVALRNSVHRAISSRYGERWWETGGIPLDGRSEGDIAKAWRALPTHVRNRPNDSALPGRLVARLMFGFWRDLLDSGGYPGR